jgi:hypothetical protein
MAASQTSQSMSGDQLGLGNTLTDQLAGETEEQRKKRLLGLSPYAAASPGVASLFGLGGTSGGIRGRGY